VPMRIRVVVDHVADGGLTPEHDLSGEYVIDLPDAMDRSAAEEEALSAVHEQLTSNDETTVAGRLFLSLPD
jgi:hypothetical protein